MYRRKRVVYRIRKQGIITFSIHKSGFSLLAVNSFIDHVDLDKRPKVKRCVIILCNNWFLVKEKPVKMRRKCWEWMRLRVWLEKGKILVGGTLKVENFKCLCYKWDNVKGLLVSTIKKSTKIQVINLSGCVLEAHDAFARGASHWFFQVLRCSPWLVGRVSAMIYSAVAFGAWSHAVIRPQRQDSLNE